MLISLTYIIILMAYTQNIGNKNYENTLIAFLIIYMLPYFMHVIKILFDFKRKASKLCSELLFGEK